MDKKKYISSYLEENIKISNMINQKDIANAIDVLSRIKKNKGRLFIIGVGGSAANASHAVNDFRKISGIEAYAPTDNVAEVTARTNDEGWETVFEEYLKVSRICSRDSLLIFSVGGGQDNVSQNIVKGIMYAKEKGATIISIVSRDGGYAGLASDVCVLVPVVNKDRVTPHAEGWQGVIWHLLVNAI